jgi:hypothetical protein
MVIAVGLYRPCQFGLETIAYKSRLRNVGDVGARGRGKEERREKKKGEVNSEDSVVNCVLSSQTDFHDRRCLLWCPSHNQKSGAVEGGEIINKSICSVKRKYSLL